MKKTALYHTASTWLIRAIIIQCVISIAALPFLIGWGLPVSLLSILGNIAHSFFLASFLSVSSALFFCYLCGIPTAPLESLLISITTYWQHLLAYGSPHYSVALRMVYIPLALIACGGLIGYFLFPRIQHRWLISFIPFSMIYLLLIFFLLPSIPSTIQNGRASLRCVPTNKGTVHLYDRGLITRTKNIDNLFDYTIMPHINRYYGTPNHIQLHAQRSSTRIKQAQTYLSLYTH